ncbi:MAG: cytochrome c biogenesis CcdA family protein [Lachnospiraceae bacterium]|nr:cytochrome c biogenesis CcdA family protein [Lachnospiraceae bacterium]MDY5742588.1 cytochrome c biogenesis CcdA family protein [Lachnospiraceae bacterium]
MLEPAATIDAVFVWGVFAAGVLSFFSPCVFPLLPVYMGILVEDTGEKYLRIGSVKIYLKPIFKTLCFIGGISFVFLLLGFGAGSLGRFLQHRYITVAMGVLVVILGLHQAEWIRIPQLYQQKTVRLEGRRPHSYLSAFLLGLSFSFGWTPCIGPVLSTVLVISADKGQSGFGVLLMSLYALGLALPFLGLSLAATPVMRHFGKLKKHTTLLKRIGGVLIILMGLLLIFGRFNLLAGLFS